MRVTGSRSEQPARRRLVPSGQSAVHRIAQATFYKFFRGGTTIIPVVAAVAEFFLPARYSSVIDVVADTVGGSLGAWIEQHSKDAAGRICWVPVPSRDWLSNCMTASAAGCWRCLYPHEPEVST